MKKRQFLTLAAAAGATLAARKSRANPTEPSPGGKEFVGVLCDTTRCIGCRACEQACARAHDLPVPDVQSDDALAHERTTSDQAWTIVNRYETDAGTVYVKKQCMHCWQPACTSACLTKAMFKTGAGPVIWRSDKCMGCRFCMISCPFDIPKFEFQSNNPKIAKCTMCWERVSRGRKPACVEACPADALMFGMKRDLMEVARTRVYNHPTHYVHSIYGEHEAGGAGWLYLAAAPFEQLGFRNDLGTLPYPQYTKNFLYSVPIVLFGLPALLLGMNRLTDPKNREEAEEPSDHE